MLSIFWVVLGHTYSFTLQTTAGNFSFSLQEYSKEFLFTTVTSGILAVDTFFFLSAFLGAYLFLSKYKHAGLGTVLVAYFHRYYRLTPLLAFILYFSTYVVFPLATGPYHGALIQGNV